LLKWSGLVPTIQQRLRSVPRHHLFSRGHADPAADVEVTYGQRLAEHVAASLGSWWFLGGQACFLVAWMIFGVLTLVDRPPWIGLNLMLSFQAGFTGPILLIAANAAAIRDHHAAAVDRKMQEQQLALLREIRAAVASSTAELRAEIAALRARPSDVA
jgi:uncharacterized membrane protein